MSSIPSKRPAEGSDPVAEARRRAEEVKARIAAVNASRAEALKNGGIGTVNRGGGVAQNLQENVGVQAGAAVQSTGQPTMTGSAADKIAAMRERIARATAMAAQASRPSVPAPPISSNSSQLSPSESRQEGTGLTFGRGAPMAMHPALLGKSATVPGDQANLRKDGRFSGNKLQQPAKTAINPYLPEAGAAPAPARKQRELYFNHNQNSRPAMAAANEMRRKAQMEEMKRRIDEKTRAAGLDDGIPISVFAVPPPPDVEWWDAELINTDIDTNPLITNLVLHPIQIEPPQERGFQTLKPQTVRLTTKEQKKMRRNRRQAEHKEEQAKIKLGLAPQPEPKVNHKNVMRVYGEMAVKDPTAVEALVTRQIKERRETHEEANAARKLTKEERNEKRKEQAAANAAMGLNMAVFRIALNKENMHNKHKYLININAQQRSDITGVVLVGPSISVAIIEGGEHSMKQYKKLMLRRIKWQSILAGDGDVQHAPVDGLGDEDEAGKGVAEANVDDTCVLLHEGPTRERKFRKWGGLREVETELQAVDALKRMKLETFWTLAKSYSAATAES